MAAATAVSLVDSETLQIDVNPFNNAGIAFTTVWPAFGVPDIDVTPTSLDFDTVTIGSSATRTMTITNTGTFNLTIHSITISSSQFIIWGTNPAGKTLAPGDWVNVSLKFTPDTEGLLTATLSIFSNDPDENPFTISLSGTGVPGGPPGGGGGGGGGGALKYFIVDFLGKITKVKADDAGRPLKNVEAYSPDGKHLLEVLKGTSARDAKGNEVTLITIRETTSPPLPENTELIGSAYNFEPTGTKFDKPIKLTLAYDVNALPENIKSIGTAYYITDLGWTYLEAENNVVAELGTLTSPVNHFTVFAILATVTPPVIPTPPVTTTQTTPPAPPPTTPTPPSPPPPPPVLVPASFYLSNLTIGSSVVKTFAGLTYFIRTGKDAAVSIDVTNQGDQSGRYTLILYVNGEARESHQVTLDPGQSTTVTFMLTANEPDSYAIEIGGLTGNFVSELWVNWWLIVATIALIVLIIWGIWFIISRRRKNRGQEEPTPAQ
jgi:hypothetical protein